MQKDKRVSEIIKNKKKLIQPQLKKQDSLTKITLTTGSGVSGQLFFPRRLPRQK